MIILAFASFTIRISPHLSRSRPTATQHLRPTNTDRMSSRGSTDFSPPCARPCAHLPPQTGFSSTRAQAKPVVSPMRRTKIRHLRGMRSHAVRRRDRKMLRSHQTPSYNLTSTLIRTMRFYSGSLRVLRLAHREIPPARPRTSLVK